MNTHSERYLCPLSGNSLIVTPQPANPMFGAVYRQHYTCRLLGAGVNQILYFFSFYNVPRLTFVASFLCPQINRQLTIQSWYKSNMQSHYLASFNSLKTKLMTLPDLPSFIVQSQSQNYLLFTRKNQVLNETFWEKYLFACWRFLFDLKKLFLLLFQITSWQRNRSKFPFHFRIQEIAFIPNTDY